MLQFFKIRIFKNFQHFCYSGKRAKTICFIQQIFVINLKAIFIILAAVFVQKNCLKLTFKKLEYFDKNYVITLQIK